jgi:hypothetical protein
MPPAASSTSAPALVNNSTISGNSAPAGYGGGIYNDGESGSATLAVGDTILKTAAGGTIVNFSGTVSSLGYNLSNDPGVINQSSGTGDLNATGDQVSKNPMLGPLQDNGGPTFTHELLAGSPAIDAGDPNFLPPPDYDQRGSGFARVVNSRLDIGAFEVQQAPRCPHPQGYWKSNPALWPASALPMMLGSQSYTKAELLKILKTQANGDASIILAYQLIAAKLNIANGSDPTPLASTISHADGVLDTFSGKLPYKVKTASVKGKSMVKDANTLANYNSGFLTAVCPP